MRFFAGNDFLALDFSSVLTQTSSHWVIGFSIYSQYFIFRGVLCGLWGSPIVFLRVLISSLLYDKHIFECKCSVISWLAGSVIIFVCHLVFFYLFEKLQCYTGGKWLVYYGLKLNLVLILLIVQSLFWTLSSFRTAVQFSLIKGVLFTSLVDQT